LTTAWFRSALSRPCELGSITDRTLEIVFFAPGAEAYCFTFG